MTGTGQRDGEAGEMHGAEGCMEGGGGQGGTGLLSHCPTHGPLWAVKGHISEAHRRFCSEVCFKATHPLKVTPSLHKTWTSTYCMMLWAPSRQA